MLAEDYYPGHSLLQYPLTLSKSLLLEFPSFPVPYLCLSSNFISLLQLPCNVNNHSTINRIPHQILILSKFDILPHHTHSLLAIPLHWFLCPAPWPGLGGVQLPGKDSAQDPLLSWSTNPENSVNSQVRAMGSRQKHRLRILFPYQVRRKKSQDCLTIKIKYINYWYIYLHAVEISIRWGRLW